MGKRTDFALRPVACWVVWLFAFTAVTARAGGGTEAYDRGDFAAAEEKFRSQAEDSDQAGPAYNLGNSLYRQGRFEESSKVYQESLKKNQAFSDGWYNLGNSLYRQEDYQHSVEAYEKALALHPEDADAKHNLELARRKLREKPPKDKKEESKDNQEQPTPTPGKGDSGQDEKKGNNPDPKEKPSDEGEKGGSQNRPQNRPEKDSRQQRQEQAKKDLGMSDEQVKRTLDNLDKQERQLQNYFSRNPKRAEKKQDDILNMLPREQQEFMRRFFGNNFPGTSEDGGQPEKDW